MSLSVLTGIAVTCSSSRNAGPGPGSSPVLCKIKIGVEERRERADGNDLSGLLIEIGEVDVRGCVELITIIFSRVVLCRVCVCNGIRSCITVQYISHVARHKSSTRR